MSDTHSTARLRRRPRGRGWKNYGLGHRFRAGFRTVKLNWVGWSALVGAGLVVGAVPVLVTRTRSSVALPSGVVAVWIVVLATDLRRWRNLTVCLSAGALDRATAHIVVEELRFLDVNAWTDEQPVDVDEDLVVVPSLFCRTADKHVAETVLARFLPEALVNRRWSG